MSDTLKIVNSNSVIDKIKEGKRADKRGLYDFRDLKMEVGTMHLADGSAWVKLGNTEVIAGIKFSLGEPYPDSPDEGAMSLNLELSGVSSPEFSTGPPQIDAVEYGRVADRAIRSAEFIDMKKLAISSGDKVFMVFIDCVAINADGNLIDATEIAALLAILNAKMPKVDENNQIIPKEYTDQGLPLNMDNLPLSITFEKIGDKIILDATDDEEFSSNARFSVGLVKDTIVSCQKSKGGTFAEKEISDMTEMAVEKYSEILKKIKNVIK